MRLEKVVFIKKNPILLTPHFIWEKYEPPLTGKISKTDRDSDYNNNDKNGAATLSEDTNMLHIKVTLWKK